MCELALERLIGRARSRIGISRYRKATTLEHAPDEFNCYTFMQWLWLPEGILLPDHQLVWDGMLTVPPEEACMGDQFFAPRRDYTVRTDDFGHVGILTSDGTIVHATRWQKGVVEDPVEKFAARGLLAIRRVKLP